MRTLHLSPRRPFDPGRLPVFYGWVIAVFSTLGIVMSIPGQTMGVSVFTDHLLRATGLTRLQFSNTYLLGTVSSGLLLPYGGRLLDRFGARAVGACACLLLGLSLLVLSQIDRVAAFFSPEAPAGVATSFAVLAVAFTLLRFSGQGMLTLTSRTMLARWFDRKRGLVTAFSGAVVSFGFSIAPILLLAWIEAGDWRSAWRGMAVVLAAMAMVAFVVFRDTPEECGLEVDGGADDPPQLGAERPPSPDRSSTARQALTATAFWVVSLGLANIALVGTALTFHIVDLGAEAGLAANDVVKIFLPISIVAVGVGFLVGYLIDRRPVLTLTRWMLLVQLGMFASAAHLGSWPGRILTVLFWGLAAGFYGPMTGAALPRLFGRAHLGSISGMMTSCLVIGSALGPAVLAFIQQTTGSYRPALYLCCGLPIAVLALSVRAREETVV